MWLWWLCRNSQRVHRLRREKAKAEADWNMKLFQTSVMIQRIIRGRLSRLHVRRMRRDFTSAVMLMQKLLRGVRARRRVSRCSLELGSVRVLCLFRCRVWVVCVCVCVCVCGCACVWLWLCVVAVAVCGFGGVGVWGCDFARAASNSARARDVRTTIHPPCRAFLRSGGSKSRRYPRRSASSIGGGRSCCCGRRNQSLGLAATKLSSSRCPPLTSSVLRGGSWHAPS